MPGTLYVVATPVGNLGDLSQRAAELLRTVPVVAAEDTRHSHTLLQHLGARPRLISFHAHSPEHRLETLIEILRHGEDVALVSDAGTPVVSDPGASLVQAVREAGIRVIPLPGPSAVTTALSAAGLPADRYLFLGFLPRKGGERKRLLAQAAASAWTVVFYEAPPRLVDLLTDLAEVAGADRNAVVARELTKLYEEFRAGSLAELAQHFQAVEPRGELTVLMSGLGVIPAAPAASPEEAATMAADLLAGGQTRKDAVRELVERLGLSRNDAYRIVMELK